MTVSNDLICMSHLRWDFAFQRPHHLMSQAAKTYRVFFVEEPRYKEKMSSHLEIRRDKSGVFVVTPFLPSELTREKTFTPFAQLLKQLLEYHNVEDYTLWTYTPLPLPALFEVSERGHKPQLVVYDCSDNSASSRVALSEWLERETQLFAWADVVFTSGYSLCEAKSNQHANVQPFPSSVDADHFARATSNEPHDLQTIPHPRLGFVGVIDERVDTMLLRQVAKECPDWHFVMIGPVVNLAKDELPRGNNVHYLGQKHYDELPDYLAHIDVAMMPFAINEATRFLSPIETLEYLAAGKSVIATQIPDVVRPYGEKELVVIAENSNAFIRGLEHLFSEDQTHRQRRATVYVNRLSWDQTWQSMERCVTKTLAAKQTATLPPAHKQFPLRSSKLTQARSKVGYLTRQQTAR